MMDQSSLADISASLIVRHLKELGWDHRSLSNGLQMLSQDDGKVEIFLHDSLQGKFTAKEVYFAVRTLSDYYEREFGQIVGEIRSRLSDRISSRIPDEYVRNDSIEFGMASDYVSSMRTFIASSATTELTRSRHFSRTVKEAIAYTDDCRFGHTFRGSFGFVIESPVELNDSPTFEDVPEVLPLGRRVVERIALGFEHIEQASRNNDPTLIAHESSGMSANMCDAIADLVENIDVSQIKFGIDLSTEWKSSLPDSRKNFQITQNNVELIRSAARSLKSEEEPTEVEIIGRIRRVATDGVPSNLFDDKDKREIEISWLSNDDNLVHIKLNVTPEEYLEAVDAHKNGKHITVKGLLPASGKTRHLKEHGRITVLDV